MYLEGRLDEVRDCDYDTAEIVVQLKVVEVR